MDPVINTSIKKRRVFYIPGYDPYPPRRYRELYRTQGEDQAGISGYDIAVRQRARQPGYGWFVDAVIDDIPVHSEIDVLLWSDLVRTSMDKGILATYLIMFRTAWIYLSTGALRRMTWLRKGPILAALYPVGMLIIQALIAIGVAWAVGALVSALTFANAGWIVAIPIAVVIFRKFAAMDRRVMAYYLMQDYGYAARFHGRNPPELDARLGEFEQKIDAALGSDVDEVLVVGHSSGAHLAIHVLSDLIRQGKTTGKHPKLALLTLGQVVPMVSFLPKAAKLRADLNFLSQSDEMTWVDVSAPGDGCSFALCDPVAVSGVAPPNKRWPLVFSAAFSQTLSKERFQKLKRRFFRLHFQYLCAFDRPGDYDYFQITAGPVALSDRYAHRNPSKSRIDVAASKYKSMKF